MTVTTWTIVSVAVALGRVLAISLVCRVGFNPTYPRGIRLLAFAIATAAFLPIAIVHP